jgi:pimeloyl-ACP methyl ester carboxylesterase
MPPTEHRVVETNGIRMHIAEQGHGPLVVLLHGFPELWYSWRHQFDALAQAGFHAVAPDLRGYGQTDCPAEISAYSQLHLVGDVIGLLEALGEQHAVVVGHDWGASLAWNTALLRPDRIRGVVGLSVPYRPRGRVNTLTAIRNHFGDRFYQAYFQAPGVADAELGRDPRATLRRLLYSVSGDAPGADSPSLALIPEGGAGWLDAMVEPPVLPGWLTEADLDVYTAEFARTGFTGGLNWYRTIDLTWQLMAPWQGATLQPPALYVAGERDLTVNFPGAREFITNLRQFVPRLQRTVLLPGVGHWTQQERPAETNAAVIEFLRAL